MSPLIDVATLRTELDSTTPPVVLDVRWTLGRADGRSAYAEGHIPGAAYVDLDTELAGEHGPDGTGGRHPLPAVGAFQEAMRRVGVRADRPVVVYGNADGWGPARAWWCLRYFGHDEVRVLDGGFPAWLAAEQPIETSTPDPVPGDFHAVPGGLPLLDAEQAASLARSGVLLDARAEARYRGEVEPMDPAAGHIPGAVSAPTTDNLDVDGRFRSADELRGRFADLAADPGAAVGVYCGSGVSGAHEVLALEVAGVPAALYAGSWSDWSSDPERPVATGSEPG